MAEPKAPPQQTRQPHCVFYQKPRGNDAPSFAAVAQKRRTTWITLDDSDEAIEVGMRMSLDSQQPAVIVHPNSGRGSIVFPLQNTNVTCGIENGPDADCNAYIKQARQKHRFMDPWLGASVYSILPLQEPVLPFEFDSVNDENWKRLLRRSWKGVQFSLWRQQQQQWETTLQIQAFLRAIQRELQNGLDGGKRQAFWYYRLYNRTDPNEPCPPPVWLFTDVAAGQEAKALYAWEPRNAFYVDKHEMLCRTIEPAKREREVQRARIENIYNPRRAHRASITRVDNTAFHFMTIRLGATKEDAEISTPEIAPGTQVKFSRAFSTTPNLEKRDLIFTAEVIEMSGPQDLTMFVENAIPFDATDEFLIAIYIKANVVPISEQIAALERLSYAKSFAELPENRGQLGFSLTRTMLAHGTELDPGNDDHFVLDARAIDAPLSSQAQQLSETVRKFRIDFILESFDLDDNQRKAFDASVTANTCGVHLIQGPPGTGKTTTTVVIVLALAALQQKVMIAGSSNSVVDNLSEAIIEALEKRPVIREWTGDLIRMRTLQRQTAEVRSQSFSVRFRPEFEATESQILQEYEMHYRVMDFARGQPEMEGCQEFLKLIEADQISPLNPDDTAKLKKAYANLCKILLDDSKIISTTLSNAACELFRSGYKPTFLVCDDAAQCTEGESAIALTLKTIRGVILVGDPFQLPPTVISEYKNNEGANYMKRSLMERLKKANYPCTMLVSHYRCHRDIMDFVNRQFYKGSLMNMIPDDYVSRVGYVWHEFTRTHHYFHANGLENLRRLCVSVDSIAIQDANSSSWINAGQVAVLCTFLRALLSFRAPNGMAIDSADMMVICPYRDQRLLARDRLKEQKLAVRENLTINASQGKEAPLVFFLTTKPSANPRSVGWVGSKPRLNVALSRAREVLIIISNLKSWNTGAIRNLERHGGNQEQALVKLLKDVSERGHTLTWDGERTVNEKEAPARCTYPCHDRSVRKPRKVVSVTPVPPTPVASGPGAQTMVHSPASEQPFPVPGSPIPPQQSPLPTENQGPTAPSSSALAGRKGKASESKESVQADDPDKLRQQKRRFIEYLETKHSLLMDQLDIGLDDNGKPLTDTTRAEIDAQVFVLGDRVMRLKYELMRT